MVQELKSTDICVLGGHTGSDFREQLSPIEDCTRGLAEYGKMVGLPVDGQAFVDHVRTQLVNAADAVDRH